MISALMPDYCLEAIIPIIVFFFILVVLYVSHGLMHQLVDLGFEKIPDYYAK